jgi:anti-anti-sigma regulatory factor
MVATVLLAESLDMQATGRLAEEIAARKGAITLDASKVAHVGGLAAQLLLAAAASRRKITVANPSDAFADGLRRLGIDPARLS